MDVLKGQEWCTSPLPPKSGRQKTRHRKYQGRGPRRKRWGPLDISTGLDDCIEPCYARFGLLMVQGRAAFRSRRIGRGSRLYRLAQGRRSVPALGGRYPAHNGIRDAAVNQSSPLRCLYCTLAYGHHLILKSKTPSRDGVLPFLGPTAPDQNSSSRYRAVSATTDSQQRARASCCTHCTTRRRP